MSLLNDISVLPKYVLVELPSVTHSDYSTGSSLTQLNTAGVMGSNNETGSKAKVSCHGGDFSQPHDYSRIALRLQFHPKTKSLLMAKFAIYFNRKL